MKNIFLAFAAMAAASCVLSCNRDEALFSGKRNIDEGEKVGCVFTLGGLCEPVGEGPALRSSGADVPTSEKEVGSFQVFIFDSGGFLVASGRNEGGGSLAIEVNSGTGYSIYAVCNVPDLAAEVGNESAIKGKAAKILDSDAGDAKFAMGGSLSGQTVSAESNQFTVEVVRRAAKVVLGKITNNLPEASGSISVDGIYLSNVATQSMLFSGDLPAAPQWTNEGGVYETLSTCPWLGEKFPSPKTIIHGGSLSEEHTFFAAANPGSGGKTTRLVVKTTIQGKVFYYPMSFDDKELPVLSANKFVNITNLTIKHLGSSSPDVPVTKDEITITVEVKDWDKTDKEVEI